MRSTKITLFLAFLALPALGQEPDSTFTCKAKLNLFNGPRIFPFVVKGKIEFVGGRFSFLPTDNSPFYQYNSVVKALELDVINIRKVRRNWLLIIPNRIVVKTLGGQKYRFYMPGKRKQLIQYIKKAKLTK